MNKNIKKSCENNIKKVSFPNRTTNTWKNMELETVCAKIIYEFKEKSDMIRLGDKLI